MSEPLMIQIIDPETGEIQAEHLMYKGQRMTVDGQELPDPTPLAPPLGYKREPTMWDIQRDAIRKAKEELARELADQLGAESFEEADDFDVDDDPDLKTRYEVDDSTDVRELARRRREEEEAAAAASQSAASADDVSAEGAKPKPKASTAKPKAEDD